MGQGGKLKVYCETSFWSFLAGGRTSDEKIARDQALTQKWWEDIAPKCEVFISQYVTGEAAKGSPTFAKRRAEVMFGTLFIGSLAYERLG